MVTLDDLRLAWRLKVLSDKGLEKSKKLRLGKAERYFEWLVRTGKSFEAITSLDLADFHSHLRTQNSVTHSKAVVRVALQVQNFAAEQNAYDAGALLSWQWPEEIADEGRGPAERNTARLPVDGLKRHFQRVWQIAEGNISTYERALTYRRLAMAELFYGGGLRAKDIIELEIATVRSAEAAAGYLTLSTGTETRLVPYTSRARRAVEMWIVAASEAERPLDRLLFRSLRARPLNATTITQEMAAFGAYTDQCGTDAISGLSLRQAFADHLLARGADIRAVGHAMGLKNVRPLEPFLPKAHAADVA